MIRSKQKGFTLLELLVVITLLAVLSVGALVAYEGIGENASNVAAANNIKTADSSIRAFRAIENVYPNQWDNLANLGGELSGGAFELLAPATKEFFGQWAASSNSDVTKAVAVALASVGINEFQTLQNSSEFNRTLLVPNEAFNESSPANTDDPADELTFNVVNGALSSVEYDDDAVTTANLSIVPSGTCQVDGASIATTFSGTTLTTNNRLNLINDNLDDDGCDLVLALGFGKDVPGTTLGSRVAISTAPTYTNGNTVNPSIHYARYIALFHVASTEDGNINDEDEVFSKPRLIAVVDTEGRTIDQAIAGAFKSDRELDD